MPVYDEIREQHAKVREKGLKYRISYFWEYYRWATLGTIVGVIFVVLLIKSIVTSKETAFQAVFVNSSGAIEAEEFQTLLDINEKKEEVLFDSSYIINLDPEAYDENSYLNMQKIVAMVTANQMDVILGYKDIAEYFGRSEMLYDLREIFGEDFVEELGDRIVWVDIDDDESDELLPVGINVSDAKKIINNQCYPYGDAYFSVVGNTKNPEWVKLFYEYIYK